MNLQSLITFLILLQLYFQTVTQEILQNFDIVLFELYQFVFQYCLFSLTIFVFVQNETGLKLIRIETTHFLL